MTNKDDLKEIILTEDAVRISLKDGRVGEERYSDYPRLWHASAEERSDYQLSYFGIHWPQIDEDLSYEGFFKRI